ncbi:MAG: hypothetical protein ACREJ0_19620 [Geminicoccaceae bacterium]
MEIINESDEVATWWCYNSDDGVKMVALKQGDLSANGGRTSYDPGGTSDRGKAAETVPGSF